MTTIQACFQLNWPGFTLDVDLELPGHGVTALFGHSGSGKTTLLRCIAGLERAAHGRLQVDGEVWQDAQRWLPVHQRPIGYVFQEASLFAHLTVMGNLSYGMKRSAQAQPARLDQAIELLGISHLLTRKPDHLSGGERQRVAMAALLAQDTPVLLLDEPAAALDIAHQAQLMALLAQRCRDHGHTVVLVSHELNLTLNHASHALLLLEQGQWQAGPVAELAADALSACLGHPLSAVSHAGRRYFLP